MRFPGPAELERLKGTPINCLAFDGTRQTQAGFEAVSLSNLPDSIVWLKDAVWPGIRAPGAGKGDAAAGPTGIPWVDSNGWSIRLAQALAPGKTVWVGFEPPKDTVLTPDAYVLALVDAEAYGGRWVMPRAALDVLPPLAQTLAFFERHKEWRSYQPAAVLGVISTFSGANEFAGGETLNLLARRHQPYRIIEKSSATDEALAGLKAVLYVDQEPPQPDLMARLLTFASSGGLLILPPNLAVPDSAEPAGEQHPRYRVRKLGAGRIAVAKDEVSDPYLLAGDSHLLMSHRSDIVRAFNAASTNSYYLRSADGKRAVVQVINYSMRPEAHPITLWVADRYRRARFLTTAKESALKPAAVSGGTELHLPPFPVYGAVELEK